VPSRIFCGAAIVLMLGLIPGLLLGACAQAPKPQPVSAAKAEAPAAQPAAAAAPAPPPAEKPAATSPRDKDVSEGGVVVIDPGEEEGSPKSLVEAARAERQRKAHAGQPVAVITNKTVAHSTGQITQAQPAGAAKKGKEAAGPGAKATVHDEAYWRQRGLDIRVRWRKASDDVERLEKEAAELRRRFYAQDDPAVRDAQIKPEWDRTLELLDNARLDVKSTEAELAAFMEEGRRAGALPGWLREGAEKEPEKKPEPAAPTESMEPPVLKEGPP
jgi:hypothetical protein